MYRELLLHSDRSCIATDKDGSIVFANQATSNLLQIETDKLIGKNVFDRFSDLSIEKIKSMITETSDASPVSSVRADIKLESGDPIPVLVLVQKSKSSKDFHHSYWISDLREQVKREERMLELDQLKNDFISMVSHELNTPITAAAGAVAILKDEMFGKLNDEQAKYSKIAERNIDRLSQLTSDLLAVSRIDSGRIVCNPMEVDLRAPVMAACQSLYIMAKDRGIELSFPGADAEPAYAYADPDRIQQVVINLVRNSIRFASSVVEVSFSANENKTGITVQDDGPGMNPEDIPHLFEKFYRGKHTGASGGGTGLGLAIVKGFIDAQNGTVSAENRDRKSEGTTGARIQIKLPSHQEVSK
ncbi:MAG: PAS domain S-box protein [Candidatus Lindowbacteria bacterium]|nr:PAS domain S-box protein [Candidatus Lindowbacteria bacterium]